jgi:Tfp pilus assembly protein PilN
MPLINLIQEHRIADQRGETKARVFFMGFVLSAVVGLGAVGFLMFLTEQANGDKAGYEANMQKLKPLLNQISETKSEYAIVAPRVDTLQAARGLTDKWSHVLDHLTVQTPEKVWLTSIRSMAADPKLPITVTFTGVSAAQELIGEFQLRLQGCPDLDSVNFKFSQEKPVADGHMLEFAIDSTLKDTQEEKNKNEGKEEKA